MLVSESTCILLDFLADPGKEHEHLANLGVAKMQQQGCRSTVSSRCMSILQFFVYQFLHLMLVKDIWYVIF